MDLDFVPTDKDHTGMVPITEGYIVDMLPIDAVARTGIVTGKQIKTGLKKNCRMYLPKKHRGVLVAGSSK
ncbi:MAG: hypothetical protein IPP04_03205 [Saprospiraceae bacterium]|nr:hypothetical protein [Saprospiraceae bacterium]